VLLNLLPVPGLDGYGVIAPYLDEGTRRTLDGMRGWGIFVLFIVLWHVEAFNDALWNAVFRTSLVLGIPIDLAGLGHELFMFWKNY
jgi:Zn-dependent protease